MSERSYDDWYTMDGVHHFDLDNDPQRLLSIMLKPDGSVVFAAYVNGRKFSGNAMAPEFRHAIKALAEE